MFWGTVTETADGSHRVLSDAYAQWCCYLETTDRPWNGSVDCRKKGRRKDWKHRLFFSWSNGAVHKDHRCIWLGFLPDTVQLYGWTFAGRAQGITVCSGKRSAGDHYGAVARRTIGTGTAGECKTGIWKNNTKAQSGRMGTPLGMESPRSYGYPIGNEWDRAGRGKCADRIRSQGRFPDQRRTGSLWAGKTGDQ